LIGRKSSITLPSSDKVPKVTNSIEPVNLVTFFKVALILSIAPVISASELLTLHKCSSSSGIVCASKISTPLK